METEICQHCAFPVMMGSLSGTMNPSKPLNLSFGRVLYNGNRKVSVAKIGTKNRMCCEKPHQVALMPSDYFIRTGETWQLWTRKGVKC